MVKYGAFKDVLRFSQEELKKLCSKALEFHDYDVQEGDGYVYGKGDIPIMLLAHLDTVHKEKPSEIFFDNEQGIMWSPQGIGGDDRCGVYTILRLLKYYKPHIMFLEDEEIGGKGAEKMIKAVAKPDIKFMIELDRRGRDDCVFYDCDNKDFKEYIESFGFKTQWGTFTDISIISPEWDVASVNLSVGYNREHTTIETINVNYMLETFQKVSKILEDEESKYYDFQPRIKYYNDYSCCTYDGYDIYDDYNLDYKKYNDNEKEEKGVKNKTGYGKPYHKGNKYCNDGYWDDDGVFVKWFGD